jgi:hypothetical protein
MKCAFFQVPEKATPHELEDFFAVVGQVRDVMIWLDPKTRKRRAYCNIEFWEVEAAQLVRFLVLGAKLIFFS